MLPPKSTLAAGGLALAILCLTGAAPPKKVLVNTDRWFPRPFSTVWPSVVSVLKEEGFSIVRAEKGKGILQTDIYEFPHGWFGPSIAIDAPTLTWDYGTYHFNFQDQGRCYLKLNVRPSGAGTRVALEALVQEWTYHRDLLKMNWAMRESNGAIEIFFLDRIEEKLQKLEESRETRSSRP